MWRAHFVILQEMPTKGRLESLADGYQLFQETRTGLFFLTAHREALRGRPDFGGFLERGMTRSVDAFPLQRLLCDEGKLKVQDHEVSFDLIQRTVSLSSQLDMPVLAAEETDDEYAMAVMADRNALGYLRFRTSLKDGTHAEVSYRPSTGLKIEPRSSELTKGLTDTAIEDVLHLGDLHLHNYIDPKPSREEAKRYASQLGMTVNAYLDSFGVFKLVGHAPPQLSLAKRLMIPIHYVASSLALPFIILGMTLFAVVNSRNAKAATNVGLWRLFLIGLVAIATPILTLVIFVRAMSGN